MALVGSPRRPALTRVLLLVARQLVHVAADLRAQAVDDVVQRLGAAGVHADEELKLVFVHPRRPGLDVRQVDALLLKNGGGGRRRRDLHFSF